MHFVFLAPQDASLPFHSDRIERINALNHRLKLRNAILTIEQRSPTADTRIKIEVSNPDNPIPWGTLYRACAYFFYGTGVNPLRERGRTWFRRLRWVIDESDTFRPDLHPVDHCITERTTNIMLRNHLFISTHAPSEHFSTRAEAIKLFERELDAHLKRVPLPETKITRRKKR